MLFSTIVPQDTRLAPVDLHKLSSVAAVPVVKYVQARGACCKVNGLKFTLFCNCNKKIANINHSCHIN